MGAAAVATLVPLAAATPAEAQTAGGGTSVTNLVLWSENLNQAVWSKANVTVGQSPVLSPRNDSAAWRVTATAAGSNDVLQQGMPNLVSGASYTFSIYVRYVNQPWIMVTSWSQNPAQAFFNIQTGTAGSRLGNCTGSSIKAAGGGWYRLSLTLTAGRNSAWPGIYPAGGDNYVNARLGDAYDIAFPQFETGSSASSYVGPTAGSPLTSQPVNGYVNTGDFAVSLGYGNNAPRLLIPANGPVTLDGAPGAGDNALSIPTTSWFWSNNGGYVTPDVFGLAGDGIKDDTLAFRKMLQSGRNVVLKQGATYLVSGSLQYGVSGQQIYLNGATVKRAAQVFSQTTADLTGGSTNVITVASTTGFAVGQTVSLRPPAGLGRAYVVNPGSGYSTTPTATITGGGGTGATASVGIDSASGRVTALAITSPGSGYTSQPSVILSGGGGSGATAQVSLQTAAADGCPTPGVITGVSGNQVIVSGASWSGAYPAGSVLFTCGFTFFASGTSGNGLHGPGIVDGNRGAATGAAPNAPYASWTTTAEVFVTAAASARHVVEGVNFRNLPGEGIVLVGSYNEVRNNVIENAGGNGIHLSLSDPATGYGPGHILITGNRVVNTNLDVTVGHENGCIAWSDDIGHSEVVNNYLDTTPLWGFGGIDGLGNNDITLSNNVVVNCGAGALLVNASSQVTVNRIAFTGNRVTNCGLGRGTYAVDIFQYYQPSPPVPIQSVWWRTTSSSSAPRARAGFGCTARRASRSPATCWSAPQPRTEGRSE